VLPYARAPSRVIPRYSPEYSHASRMRRTSAAASCVGMRVLTRCCASQSMASGGNTRADVTAGRSSTKRPAMPCDHHAPAIEGAVDQFGQSIPGFGDAMFAHDGSIATAALSRRRGAAELGGQSRPRLSSGSGEFSKHRIGAPTGHAAPRFRLHPPPQAPYVRRASTRAFACRGRD
jgi:hypothetical protein